MAAPVEPPVTQAPPAALFHPATNGMGPILWDNGDVAESFSGVTTPLTFSFVAHAYQQIFSQFCLVMGVPPRYLAKRMGLFGGMLGLVRGRIYCNVVNWCRIAHILPWFETSPGQALGLLGVHSVRCPPTTGLGAPPEQAALAGLFDVAYSRPRYGLWARSRLAVAGVWRFVRLDHIVADFQHHFDTVFGWARNLEFRRRSLPEQLAAYRYLDRQLLQQWTAPIIIDAFYFAFYGLLKRLSMRWLHLDSGAAAALQNELLCGQGDLQSLEPTKMLMRIAQWVRTQAPQTRDWLLATEPERVAAALNCVPSHAVEFKQQLDAFLQLYGFRCADEMKLEAVDLHTDPSCAVQAIVRFIRLGCHDTEMKQASQARTARTTAALKGMRKLRGIRRLIYFRLLKYLTQTLHYREKMRFLRTQAVGVVRHLFLAMGENLMALGAIAHQNDVFYLTCDEVFAFIEGRSLLVDLKPLVSHRQAAFTTYKQTPAPPQRFVTYGAASASMAWPHVLAKGDLTATPRTNGNPTPTGGNPAPTLWGTPCAAGIVEGVVRVAANLEQAQALHHEILVTVRTDFAWVLLYPACRGLLLEQGALLSHSSVVAREWGLPSIVELGGGLMTRLRTGMRVRMNGATGEVTVLADGAAHDTAANTDMPQATAAF